jgi:hypothetical protein
MSMTDQMIILGEVIIIGGILLGAAIFAFWPRKR